jgi:hypothetical protein
MVSTDTLSTYSLLKTTALGGHPEIATALKMHTMELIGEGRDCKTN